MAVKLLPKIIENPEKYPTGRHNDMGIAWEISIYGCMQLGLKVDLPVDYVGSQLTEESEINYAMGNF